MPPPPRLLLLPGMAADARMHAGLARLVPWLRPLDWGPAERTRSIDAAASALIAHHDLRADDLVGGSSLGGIVAGRIAERIDARRLVLLGSALDPREIAWPLRHLMPLGQRLRHGPLQALAGSSRARLLCRMYASVDPRFIRAMIADLRGWRGYQGGSPVLRIHGDRDRVIRPRQGGKQLVRGAGHLLAMTHPADCAALLRRWLVMEDSTTPLNAQGQDA